MRPSVLPRSSVLPTNVVRFQPARRPLAAPRDQRSFLDAVYAAGSLPVPADDHEARSMAARLQVFGFVAIDEVQADGSLRRLKASEARAAQGLPARARPWRVSKAALAWAGVRSEAEPLLA